MMQDLLGSRAARGLIVGTATVLFLALAALEVVFDGNVHDLVAAATSTVSSPPALAFLIPYAGTDALTVGDTAMIDVDIDTRVPINSLGASITYPKDSLEVLGFSKERSFLDLWTEDTTLKEESGELDFSGGTTRPGGITGTSTALTITVRAKKAGAATISFGNVQLFAADGKGTAVETGTRSLTFHIADVATTSGSGGGSSAPVPAPTPPNPDLNGDGKVTVLDVSKLMVQMVLPYNPRYDLNLDGKVGLSDLSVLFSQLGR